MRLVACIYAFVAFFVTLALVAIAVGVHDAALARSSLGVTASSAMLIVVGVVLVVAACQLVVLGRRRSWNDGVRPPCKPVVLVAFLLTILVGVCVFFSTVRTATVWVRKVGSAFVSAVFRARWIEFTRPTGFVSFVRGSLSAGSVVLPLASLAAPLTNTSRTPLRVPGLLAATVWDDTVEGGRELTQLSTAAPTQVEVRPSAPMIGV